MKVSFNGVKKDFSQVLADWLARGAKGWSQADEPNRVVSKYYTDELRAILRNKSEAEELLRLLKLMTGNRIMFEMLIGFAARYKSACGKATVEDVKAALDLISVMEVQQQ
jgi:hypothetical protein